MSNDNRLAYVSVAGTPQDRQAAQLRERQRRAAAGLGQKLRRSDSKKESNNQRGKKVSVEHLMRERRGVGYHEL